MKPGKIPALIGGTVGVVAAAGAAGLAHQYRQLGRDRAAGGASALSVMPISRQRRIETPDAITLHVEEVGPSDAALTVVFVHGFTLNLQAFHFQRRALAEQFGDSIRMVFFDLRSHGRSDKSPVDKCTIDELGRDVQTLIKAVAPTGELVLVAHSMGGMSVMSLAQQHPELFCRRPDAVDGTHATGVSSAVEVGNYRVGSVALLNSSAGNLRVLTLGLPHYLARLGAPVLPFVLRRAAQSVELVEKTRSLAKDVSWLVTKRLSFASRTVPAEIVEFAASMIAATRVDVVSAFYASVIGHNGSVGLKNLAGCDVLVIGAEHDAMIPCAHSQIIADALPNSTLVIVADAGHLAMLEHPDAVNAPLIELVESALKRARSQSR